MSVQAALQFIEQLLTNKALKLQKAGLVHCSHLDGFVELGTQIGLIFTADELEAAHRHDWGMRWLIVTNAYERSYGEFAAVPHLSALSKFRMSR